jgi:hypothetical protein
MRSDSSIGNHIEELALPEPGSSCWLACCLSDFQGSGRIHAGEEWNRALSLIPIKDKDTEILFKSRVAALKQAGLMESEDAKGRTLLWHAAYYNDSAAAIVITKLLPHTQLILEPDNVYVKSPLQLSKMHRNLDVFDVFREHVNQRDLDEHWHHKNEKDTLLER